MNATKERKATHTRKNEITLAEITWHSPNMVFAAFERGGLRYHFWLDPKTGGPLDETLYCNPPLAVKYSEPEHFTTRHLSRTAKANAGFMDAFKGLDFAASKRAFEEQQIAELEQERKANEERARLEKIRDAAPELLDALRGVLIAISETDAGRCGFLKANTGRDYNEHMDFARAAIAKTTL